MLLMEHPDERILLKRVFHVLGTRTVSMGENTDIIVTLIAQHHMSLQK